MEEIVDTLITFCEEVRQEPGFSSAYFMQTPTKFGDPGIVEIHEYPYFYVSPISDVPVSGTIGRIGWDTRQLTVQIGLCLDVSDYFDPEKEELPGIRTCVQIMTILRKKLRQFSNITLRDLEGVQDVVVQNIDYRQSMRGYDGNDAYVMMGVLTATVVRRYPHED